MDDRDQHDPIEDELTELGKRMRAVPSRGPHLTSAEIWDFAQMPSSQRTTSRLFEHITTCSDCQTHLADIETSLYLASTYCRSTTRWKAHAKAASILAAVVGAAALIMFSMRTDPKLEAGVIWSLAVAVADETHRAPSAIDQKRRSITVRITECPTAQALVAIPYVDGFDCRLITLSPASSNRERSAISIKSGETIAADTSPLVLPRSGLPVFLLVDDDATKLERAAFEAIEQTICGMISDMGLATPTYESIVAVLSEDISHVSYKLALPQDQ